MRVTRISLFRFAAHRIWRSFRRLEVHIDEIEIVERLVAQRRSALKEAVTTATPALVLALWMGGQTKKDIFVFSLFNFDLQVPAVYLCFATAFLLFAAGVGTLSYFILNEAVRLAINKFLKHDDAEPVSMLFDGISAWTLVFAPEFRFFSSSKMHWLATLLAAAVAIGPILICYFLISYITTFVALGSIPQGNLFSWTLVALTVILVAAPIILTFVLFLPFSFQKNPNFIRFNFLYPHFYRKLKRLVPNNWLNEN